MVIPLRDDNPTSRFPVLTVLLIAANIFIFAFVQPHSDTALNRFDYEYAAIPCELVQGKPASVVEINNGVCNSRLATPPAFPHKNVYLAVLVSMFLHGSWLHVLGNMLFLWIFGDNVEDALGHLNFLVCYLAFGAVAGLAQFFMNPLSTIPNLGASGAIAGVLGFYLVLYPAARVLTLFPLLILFWFFRVPAIIFLAFWFFLQTLSGVATLQQHTEGGVAYWAHIGGFVVGLGLGIFFRVLGKQAPDGTYRARWS